MDWTEKLERRKRIRKMAYRMLWADFRDMLFSWKVFLIGLTYLGFFLFPYLKMEDFNFACLYYFVTWVVIALNAVSETVSDINTTVSALQGRVAAVENATGAGLNVADNWETQKPVFE